MNNPRLGAWTILSTIMILLGIMCWTLYLAIPSLNIGFDEGIPLWTCIFVLNPVGIILGIIGQRMENNRFAKWSIIGNVIMLFSIFPVVWIVTIVSGP
ncbi:hypothetical protein [Laceyella sacchari]|jgi:hypothetical protein|uniref:Uncharacterized protein n=1 Tax=Laceyella sacchari TaxID=37482 RepID=A0ABY5U5Y9_LACSH|nr:hypothetical protein [Laceyella sacchari]UWE05063.1 hypothetical protein NYR52_08090 [Laceyella sacchari]